MQTRLADPKVKYSYGAYNKYNETEQWIRITEGCPNNCPYCYEPTEFQNFGIPEIVRNDVKIMDMNLIAKPEANNIILELGQKRVNGNVVHYELVCGVDFRFMTQYTADILKRSRFVNIRIAWDWFYKDQKEIKKTIDYFLKAGYKPNDIMVFMICNWRIPIEENMKKMDLCKVWNVKIADCYYDNQTFPNVQPIHWTFNECKEFRRKVRKHNQLVNFKIDPELRQTLGGKA